ncbi:MAG: hypothetical protein WBX07_14840, partial [Rhodoplanes sp.]
TMSATAATSAPGVSTIRQSSVLFEIEEALSDLLAALQYDPVRPSTRPREPASGSAFPAKQGETEQVVQPAAVDSGDDDFTSSLQFGQQCDMCRRCRPKVGADPVVTALRRSSVSCWMVKCSKSEVQRLKTALRWKIPTIEFNLLYAFVMVRLAPTLSGFEGKAIGWSPRR